MSREIEWTELYIAYVSTSPFLKVISCLEVSGQQIEVVQSIARMGWLQAIIGTNGDDI
jgi:hypothetical protein